MSPDSIGDEIRRFEEQYRRNPHGLVFARLADAHRKAGDPESALEILDEGIARHPEYPSGHLVRARALIDLSRADEAEASLRRVLELDPRNLVALRGLASLAEKRGDAAEAVRLLEQATIYEPSDAEVEADLDRLRAQLPSTAEPMVAADRATLPAPDEEWWSSPPDTRLSDPAAGVVEPESVEPEPAEVAPGASDFVEAPPSDAAADQPDDVSGPVDRVEPIAEHAAEPAAQHGAEPDLADETSGADVSEPPPAVGSQNAWWFEDPDEAESPDDGDLLTRTMAELYVKQGLLTEAAAIYRELSTDRPDDEGLRAALAELEARIGGEADKTEGDGETDEPPPVEAAAADMTDMTDMADMADMADMVEAGTDPTPAPEANHDPEPPVADPYATHPVPRRAGTGDAYRDWIRRLSE